jgi:hypothetical protein
MHPWTLTLDDWGIMVQMNPFVSELSLYDIAGTPGVAADVSHINQKAIVKVSLPLVSFSHTFAQHNTPCYNHGQLGMGNSGIGTLILFIVTLFLILLILLITHFSCLSVITQQATASLCCSLIIN